MNRFKGSYWSNDSLFGFWAGWILTLMPPAVLLECCKPHIVAAGDLSFRVGCVYGWCCRSRPSPLVAKGVTSPRIAPIVCSALVVAVALPRGSWACSTRAASSRKRSSCAAWASSSFSTSCVDFELSASDRSADFSYSCKTRSSVPASGPDDGMGCGTGGPVRGGSRSPLPSCGSWI